MRLSFNMKFNAGLDGILTTQQKMNRAQDQLTKQTRILTPADDPAASAKVLGLDQNLEQVAQFQNNSVLLKNNLALEETVLTNMRTSIDRARVLAIASGNGAYTEADKKAVAQELKNIQVELLDLMNSRNAEGGYIFSGFQDKKQTYSLNNATGIYEFQGDDGQKALQISPTIALAGNDSGKFVFEDVNARFKTTPAVISAGGATAAEVSVTDQSQFDAYYKQNYDALTPANNDFSVVLTAPSTYEIQRNGASLVPPVTGTFTPDAPIAFNGLTINISGAAAVPGQVDFSLQAPEKKNILTTIGEFITALENPALSAFEFNEAISDTLTQTTAAATNIDSFLSSIGGRVNVLDSVFGTNEDLTVNNKAYRADLSEVDYAAALTEITKQEIALQAISNTFVKVSGVSLFDYIR
ncbi:flagellar hook-associated protein FlgL [Rheinheimera nanhaiensis]|uniref:Flagellar hook-associated protein 3 FlgL n=1 Tax=Rheinheimera nanhaiensis E407-8 TaxID=562729 RepID=I1DWN3_9GAMM|nr:flagellar hook-associated protein FlgL [Rheinheimera nanhaiensis]GAB58461.1 flagellar hook-associated protein 3 FlgL [Rheinheimera nanhaiensis E407-8]